MGIKDRITVVEQIYYQASGDNPVFAGEGFVKEVQQPEQVYLRMLTLGQDWQEVPLGWITSLGLLLISNCEGKDTQQLLTPTQKEELAKLIVEVQIGQTPWRLQPGESLRGCPQLTQPIMARCQQGAARIQVIAMPG